MVNSAALGIVSAKHQPSDPRVRNRLRAHRARLQRDIQVAIIEPRRSLYLSRRPKHDNFRMTARIAIGLDLIAGDRQDSPRRRIDHRRADWYFAHHRRAPRRFQCLRHGTRTCHDTGHTTVSPRCHDSMRQVRRIASAARAGYTAPS